MVFTWWIVGGLAQCDNTSFLILTFSDSADKHILRYCTWYTRRKIAFDDDATYLCTFRFDKIIKSYKYSYILTFRMHALP